jgi:virginiamycin A acetyltransferase
MKKIIRATVSKCFHPRAIIGKGSYAAPSSTIGHGTIIGDYSYVNKGAILSNVIVGNYCSIAAYTLIGSGEHDLSSYSTSLASGVHEKSLLTNACVIGSDVWIGAGAVIRRGITIGHGAVIGANTVVTRDVEPYSVVVGAPGREIKKRFGKEILEILLSSEWWKLEPGRAKKLLSELRNQNS